MFQELHFPVLDSTNAYAKSHADALEDLTFIRADFQSKGKGRDARTWLAKAGENLLFSLLVKEKNHLQIGPQNSLIAAVNVAKAIESLGINDVQIKWPNDVYIQGKKACGILLEGKLPDYLVIGIGINVNQREFLSDYRVEPTSLALSLGKDVDLISFKNQLFKRLYDAFQGPVNFEQYLKEYRARDYLYGKKISMTYQGSTLEGTAKGADEEFKLLLETSDGLFHLESGEVHVVSVS